MKRSGFTGIPLERGQGASLWRALVLCGLMLPLFFSFSGPAQVEGLLAWGAAATLKTAIHEVGHVVLACAAGADRAWIISIVPYCGRAAWHWPSPPTLSQKLLAQAGGMALCRGLSEVGGPWEGEVGWRLQWLLRLDPFLYVLRSLAGELGLLPRLAGDDVAKILYLLAEEALEGRVGTPERLTRERRRLVRTLYGAALLLTTVDLLGSWAGGRGPLAGLSWEVRF